MGLFNVDYNKNGPGVSKNEPKKKGFFLFWEIYFRKFWRLIGLNLIFVIACCTVVFIGPAMAGFTYVLRNFSREKHAFVWSDFIDTAKKNLKQSLLVGFLNALLIGILGYAIYFWYGNYTRLHTLWTAIPLAGCVIGAVLFLFMHYYIYLILVTFDIDTKKLYKNAFILAVYALPRNLLTTLILIACSLFLFTVTTGGYLAITALGIVVLLFLYFSFVGLATVSMSYPVIRKVMIDPYQKTEEPIQEEPLCSDETEETDE